MKTRLILSCTALMTLGACATAVSPPPSPAIMTPDGWRADASALTLSASADETSREWWRTFSDPILTTTIEKALARNTDLAMADTRIREAEAMTVQARSALLPMLNLSAGGQDARSLSPFGQPSETATGQVQLQAGYEIDLWGRVRNADAAARASLQASRHARDAAVLSVAAATARTYVTLLSFDAQLSVARETLTLREASLRLARRRAESGLTSRLELNQAEAELQAARQRVPALELAVSRQENALRLLLDEPPSAVARGRLADITLPIVAPGLPSALLERRPDIAQAEAQLSSSDAELAASRAALLPQVSLTASVGELFVEHIDPITVWSLGGSVLAPLFDGGRRVAQSDAAAARRDRASLAYRQTVLNAFVEVENALEGAARQTAQHQAAIDQAAALRETLRHASNRYQAGYASYLEQLDAQRGLLAAELGVLQLREAQLANAVALYQALGGGWSPAAPSSTSL